MNHNLVTVDMMKSKIRSAVAAVEARAAQLEIDNDEMQGYINEIRVALHTEKDELTIDAVRRVISERDRLLAQVQPENGIPIIAEITPHPDPVYGHCFQWPAQEVDQFIEMSADDDAA